MPPCRKTPQAVAVSSYQGGHMEFFRYLKARLREQGAAHIRVFGGGGGTITPAEIDALRGEGVARIFGPDDGRALGLDGMIREIVEACEGLHVRGDAGRLTGLAADRREAVARLISWLEESRANEDSGQQEALATCAGAWTTSPRTTAHPSLASPGRAVRGSRAWSTSSCAVSARLPGSQRGRWSWWTRVDAVPAVRCWATASA